MPLHQHPSRSIPVQPELPQPPTRADLERCGLNPYQLQPPEWRLPTQINQPELGYPGLHPTHPGQQEDAMTKSLVQGGFSARTLVGTESFSAHQMIYKKLNDDTGFNISSAALSALIEARRRYCAINSYDTKSTIKVPGRVVLNDQKRENWLRELADSSVPLLKLSKNVPHGFKSEKLLEMLVNRKIDAARATWYIRIIGLNEINAQRNKSDLSHIRYTLSFTSEICQFLQKQLGEVTVPMQLSLSLSTTSLITASSRLAGMNVRSKPRSSTLSDPETRKSWVAKWSQSCQLLKRLYYESLLDQPTFFKWLVDQLKLANLAQVNFLLEIHRSILDRICLSSNLVRGFVEACLGQLRFITKQTATPYLSKLEHRLKVAIKSSFIFCPDNFVWPDLWTSNKILLEDIILSNLSMLNTPHNPFKPDIKNHQVKEVLRNDFFAVNWRVSELVGEAGIGTGVVRNTFTRRAQLVEVLDNYTDYSDGSKLYYRYFLNPSVAGHTVVPFRDKLEVLLSWATTPLRTSDKRVYLTSNTLSHVKHDRKKSDDEFQNILIGWLEQIEASEGGDLLVRLFSELSRRNIFSYGAYVQRMVAKGDTESDILVGKASGLQTLLSEWMPLASSKALRERNSHLKRSPGRDAARNGLMTAIADINAAVAAADHGKLVATIRRRLDVSQPTSANRKILTEILPDALVHLITDISPTGLATSGPSMNQRPIHSITVVSVLLTWGVQLLESCQAYKTLFEVIHRVVQIDLNRIETLRTGEQAYSDPKLSWQSTCRYLQVVCMVASSHREILEINGQLVDLVSRLFTIYVQLRRLTGGVSLVDRSFVRCLRSLVIESNLMDGQILEVLDKENHFAIDAILSGPSNGESLPSYTGEILHLLQFPSAEQASRLVSKFWENHRSDMDWGPALWNSLVTAIKLSYQEQSMGKGDQEGEEVEVAHWITARTAILQFCEDLDTLYDEGLIGCIIRAGSFDSPHTDDQSLFQRLANGAMAKQALEEKEEAEEGEEIAGDSPPPKIPLIHLPRSLCPSLRRLLVELIATGLLSIEVVLEEFALRPIADDIPQKLIDIRGATPSDGSAHTPPGEHRTGQVEDVLEQLKEIYRLVNETLAGPAVGRTLEMYATDKSCPMGSADTPMRSMSHSSMLMCGSNEAEGRMRNAEYEMEEYVRIWRLNVERRLWFEQSEEGSAFCSRLLLSLLMSTKTVSDIISVQEAAEEPTKEEPYTNSIYKILQAFEQMRFFVCNGVVLLRRMITLQAVTFLNPILELVEKNDLGSSFNTSLIQAVDELLPYPQPADLSNHKYPYLESIFKATCIFSHSARTRQFQLHIRLLMSENPPLMPSMKESSFDLSTTLGGLVEVMARRLHLTDSKEASPFFLDCLPASVAEALVIKLSAYLGMSICKLLAPTQVEPAPEVSRIHHICRCITTLTNQLATRTYQMNDDVTIKILGGSGQLGCNATVDSYMSYWQQLKTGLTHFNTRLKEFLCADVVSGPRRMEFRIMRALLHSMQVMLWSLPGLTQHLGPLKHAIAEIWVEIALRLQGDVAMVNQIMDTVAILLFPTGPDESSLTTAVGLFRKRYRWLYQPVLNLDRGTHLMASCRLKYILGSSLRGSTSTFQERLKDGAVKFVEEKPWEELEKMDMCGPGFISIDALKCQTLSQVEPVPDSKRSGNSRLKWKRPGGETEDVVMGEDVEDGGEGGEDRMIEGTWQDDDLEEEEGPMRGERDSFEHELITDGLSTMPLHFLRSLYPPPGRLEGADWAAVSEHQKRVEIQQAAQQQNQARAEQDSSRAKKRKVPATTASPAEQPTIQTSSVGPTLRSARSTRKKSSAAAASSLAAGTVAPQTTKRGKKR